MGGCLSDLEARYATHHRARVSGRSHAASMRMKQSDESATSACTKQFHRNQTSESQDIIASVVITFVRQNTIYCVYYLRTTICVTSYYRLRMLSLSTICVTKYYLLCVLVAKYYWCDQRLLTTNTFYPLLFCVPKH